MLRLYSLLLIIGTGLAVGCGWIDVERLEATSSDADTDTDTDTDSDADTDADADTEADTGTDTEIAGCGVPQSFQWTASDILINPPEGSYAVKDPAVVFLNGQWQIYATAVSESGLSMTYLSFDDWNRAIAAEQTAVSTNDNLAGYKAAPQLFYFSAPPGRP